MVRPGVQRNIYCDLPTVSSQTVGEILCEQLLEMWEGRQHEMKWINKNTEKSTQKCFLVMRV